MTLPDGSMIRLVPSHSHERSVELPKRIVESLTSSLALGRLLGGGVVTLPQLFTTLTEASPVLAVFCVETATTLTTPVGVVAEAVKSPTGEIEAPATVADRRHVTV